MIACDALMPDKAEQRERLAILLTTANSVTDMGRRYEITNAVAALFSDLCPCLKDFEFKPR